MMVNPSSHKAKCMGLLLGKGSDQDLPIRQFRPSEQDVVVCLVTRHGTDNTSKDLPVDTGLLLTNAVAVGQTEWRQKKNDSRLGSQFAISLISFEEHV